MRLAMVAAALLAAGTAHAAEKRFGVHAMTALLIADFDVDKVDPEGGGPKLDGRGDDLERNFGIEGTYEVPIQGAFRVGGRLGFLRASGDDDDIDHNTFDFGGWARYVFRTSAPIEPFAALGLGATYISFDGETREDFDAEGSGIGWHFLLGGGVTYAVSSSVDLYGALHYLRQAAFDLDGELGTADATYEDIVYSRFLIVAGAMF
jgi:opacity protein-like surface antigen